MGHARHAQSNLREWMATKRKPTPFPVNLNIPVHSELSPNPRGVALILTPWNLPVQMSLNPLVNALAAGNVCVLTHGLVRPGVSGVYAAFSYCLISYLCATSPS